MLYLCMCITYFDNSDMKALTEQLIGQTFSLLQQNSLVFYKLNTDKVLATTLSKYSNRKDTNNFN